MYSVTLPFLLAIASTTLGAPTARDTFECTQIVMEFATDSYVAAQATGQLDPLFGWVNPNWTYIENNVVTDVRKGVLSKSLRIDHNRTNMDLTQCATYTELISADPANPYVIGTQIFFNIDMKIVSIDSIVTTTNSWLFNATKTLQLVQGENWDPIPEAKRDSRAAIQAAGDAYMDIWSNATAANVVPWGSPCVRMEGSAYTGSGKDNSCKSGIPTNHNQKPNTHRRYVIDEAMGSVSILDVWEHMMNAADSHEFRLENGKLRFVHTMTSCGGKRCTL